jgi:hypothetical protein
MPRYNRTFDLSVEDLDLIEGALHRTRRDLAQRQEGAETMLKIHDLLGRLHNQKTFYRPRSKPYVSG